MAYSVLCLSLRGAGARHCVRTVGTPLSLTASSSRWGCGVPPRCPPLTVDYGAVLVPRRTLAGVAASHGGLSYWHRPGEQPLQYATLGQLVGRAAERFGDSEALVCLQDEARLSFRELQQHADQLAAGLLELGLRRGDAVALWAGNSSRWVVARLALARAGLVAVDLNPQYREAELAHCLRLTRAVAVLADDVHRGGSLHDVLAAAVPELRACSAGRVCSAAFPDLKFVISLGRQPLPGALLLADVMAAAGEDGVRRVEEDQWRTSPDSVASIQMSSGTTGKPKAIQVSHMAVVNNSFVIGMRMGLREKRHKVLLQVPLFHAYGTVIVLMPALHFGAELVLPAPAFSASHSLRALRHEPCSVLTGTPTMYVDLASLVQEEELNVRADVAMIAGSPITPQLAKRMGSVLGVARISSFNAELRTNCMALADCRFSAPSVLQNGYGLSETSGLVCQGKDGDSVDCMADTVGSISDHIELKVVDESGETVPFGSQGELWVRGYSTMKGYLDDPAANAAAFQDGWFKTGDKFILREDGYGQVCGRIKDMIIRGGENIYPKEVEDVLSSHPDVLEAEVVGVPDERLGEAVCACVRLRTSAARMTAASLRAFCRGRMADYKVPRYCAVLNDFPRTLSGKIQKYVLRESCAAALAAGRLDDGLEEEVRKPRRHS